jgi:hypothetical protein
MEEIQQKIKNCDVKATRQMTLCQILKNVYLDVKTKAKRDHTRNNEVQ